MPVPQDALLGLDSQKSDPFTDSSEVNVQEKPSAKPLQTHQALAGKESSSQQICSHSLETNLVSSCTLRSDNIDASSETDLRLALGPGILQFFSILYKVLP